MISQRQRVFASSSVIVTVLAAWGLLIATARANTSNTSNAPQDIGEFVAFCPLSHRAPDDPIVHKNMPGMSHLHDFLGNVTTNASSTVESLLVGGTTCDPVSDKSSYWVPSLLGANGQPIALDQVTIYYQVEINNPKDLKPFPPGLKIVAGNSAAITAPNPSHFKWACQGQNNSSTTDFVICPQGSKLELLLNFPDCWDGQNLDSADHKSHMAYSANHACPTSHPVAVPLLQFKLRYATRGEAGMKLASLGTGSAAATHGDFFNAWDETALANRMNCLRELIKCGAAGYPGKPDATPVATPVVTATSAPPKDKFVFLPIVLK
jgi:Domain of unknown function (DUF1996)